MEFKNKVACLALCLLFLTVGSFAQNSNVGLFFYTTAYAESDSTAFMEKQSNTLKDDLMYSYGFRASSYPNYSKVNFLNSIENECRSDSSKHLFIYITGRIHKDDNGSFLLLNSSDKSDPASMISMDEITAILTNCNSQHVLAFLDVPGTGVLKDSKEFEEAEFEDVTDLTGRDLINNERVIPAKFLIASNADSIDMGGSRHYSVLSSKFLEALRNYGEDDGVLTIEELSYYVNNIEPSPFIGIYKPTKGSDFLFISK